MMGIYSRFLLAIALVTPLSLSGCANKAIAPFGQDIAQSPVDLAVVPQFSSGRDTLAVVTKNASASVDHVSIYLLAQVDGEYRPLHNQTRLPITSLDDANAYRLRVEASSDFANHPITVKGLKRNANYKLRGRAYNSSNQLLSKDDSSCEATVSVTTDDRPVLPVRLPIAMKDVEFAGRTQLNLAVIRPGVATRVLVSLLRQDNATILATKSYAIEAMPATMSVANLQPNTTYQLKADALNDVGASLVSTSALCVVTNNDRPAEVSLSVKVPYQVLTLAGSAVGYQDGPVASAQFHSPRGIALGPDGNLYIADCLNNTIRKISNGVVSTFAGSSVAGNANGVGTAAQFNNPNGLHFDAEGNLYVADTLNDAIRKITPAGVVSTIATGSRPFGIAIDHYDYIYFSENGGNRIRKISASDKDNPSPNVTTLAGGSFVGNTDGVGTGAAFTNPQCLTIDSIGNLYVSQTDCIRKVTTGGVVTTLPGVGGTLGLATDDNGSLYIAKQAGIVKRSIADGTDTFIAGMTEAYVLGTADGFGSAAKFSGQKLGLYLDTAGNLYVSDADSHRLRKVL